GMAEGHGRGGGAGAAVTPFPPGSTGTCFASTGLGAIATRHHARNASMVGAGRVPFASRAQC
ncbi:MAG: hypothetical protein NWQ37_14595, partial [Marivita lacus]|nr:hypothetical protein [Marivita lacus]